MPDVSIINYGINNLKSVSMAFEKLGKTWEIIDKPEEILKATCLILPGIGAFGDGMKRLSERKLIDPIKQKVKQGIPLLGICLGMQMLFSESKEFGVHKGLDLIEGKVVPFNKPNNVNIEGYKVPHMGWNQVESKWKHTLLSTTKEKSDVYFVHSFYPQVKDAKHVMATTEHGGQRFCSVVKKDNVTGTQFHPEKSGEVGLNMLKKFCELNKI